MIRRILIANRGEIAVRVIRTCQELGIETVAIYSDADKEALHAQLADVRYRVGTEDAFDSYLNREAIIDAAKTTEADAVHPGYGFLSENVDFAAACEKAGIEFIGPTAEMMDNLGDKIKSKLVAQSVGVPTVPGVEKAIETEEQA
ncbi:MAG: acetyl-CoA carboxylase biotin carboxylase subunit, partial [Selenomonadaceae bacterium]|nr:acetyl-CoA carboxylase biotin carboxylase subunit [Selenomonadaceae bacterium]